MKITRHDLSILLMKLKGMNVSFAWKGYGSAIFLELGELQKDPNSKRKNPDGEACISVEWDWRAEKGNEIIFGSSDSRPSIQSGIQKFVNHKIESITLEGTIPELSIVFSDGFRLNSMSMTEGDPQWSIKQIDKTWIYWNSGNGVVENGDEKNEISLVEKEYADILDEVANRWGTPKQNPILGNCENCKYMIRIDGDFALLDYGVCINKQSNFDGHTINLSSGCPYYKNTQDE